MCSFVMAYGPGALPGGARFIALLGKNHWNGKSASKNPLVGCTAYSFSSYRRMVQCMVHLNGSWFESPLQVRYRSVQ